MNHEDRLTIISRNRLFRDLDSYAKDFLASRSVSRTYYKGRYLLSKGTTSKTLILIVTGLAKVSLTSAFGREFILAFYMDGDIAGLTATATGFASRADLIAEKPTLALCIEHDALKALDSDAAFNQSLRNLLLERYAAATGTAEMLALCSLRERLARQLLVFLKMQPALLNLTPVFLSQEKLAFLTNATRPKVNQHLQVFKAAGAIRIEAGRIQLVNPDILESFAAPV
ncbi:Crp/Fnr family transcriptional regulator [Roseibium aggregatum]|uniref:Crp/Fnr family transcriptional regulator n=1 Tax=Roseibium aggregatum TaxID=187304 RepID=A0A939EGH0_9HYPH|nr:Crp/Fnr family transcriptional regulator [Roseibium aggregatum]MBN9671320.1 Crp/Fnr family transcriptional regulator [Roseibium aggregatum]